MSSPSPLFTILTLCYNHAPYLDDYFQGLLSQTYTNIQLIIHDDCSTDGSWVKIQEYLPLVQAKFTEVICERSEPNLGMLGAVLKVSTPERIQGKYLSFLESDDYYLPERVEKVVAYLETHPDIGLVHSGAIYKYEGTGVEQVNLADPMKERVEGWMFDTLLNGNVVIQCTIAFRYDLFRQIDLFEIASHSYLMFDYPINLAMARLAPFGYLGEALVYYRVREGSASRPIDAKRRLEFVKSTFQIAIDAAVEANVPKETIKHFYIRYYYLTYRIAFMKGEYNACMNALKWLHQNVPSQLASLKYRALLTIVGSEYLREMFKILYSNYRYQTKSATANKL